MFTWELITANDPRIARFNAIADDITIKCQDLRECYHPLLGGICADVATLERLDVDERKAGETAEHKRVAHHLQARKLFQFKLHHTLQFRFGQRLALCHGALEPLAEERFISRPFIGDDILHHIFKVAEITHGSVIGGVLLMLEVLHEAFGLYLYRNVAHISGQLHELLKVGPTAHPTLVCRLAHVTALILGFTLFIRLAEHIAQHLRLLDRSEEMATQDFRIDQLPLAHEHIVDFKEAGTNNLDVLVQFKVTAAAPR